MPDYGEFNHRMKDYCSWYTAMLQISRRVAIDKDVLTAIARSSVTQLA